MNKKTYLIVIFVVLAAVGWLLYQNNALPFVSEAPQEPAPTQSLGECYVGGCSSQICSDQPDAVSTCEFREEYACYQSAKCERQPSGECGWTETAELKACLNVSL